MTTTVIELGGARTVSAHEIPPALKLVYDTVGGTWHTADATGGKQHTIGYLWDTVGLQFVVPTVATGGTGSSVIVTNFPATQAVTGTFWQATQPVSGSVTVSNMVAQGLTDAQLRATAVPVSIASLPSVAVSNFPATQAVSIASMPSTPVTGTFFQATQPVSLAVAPTTPIEQRRILPQFAAISVAASGDNTLVAAAGAGLKIKVLQYTLVAAGTVGVTLKSGAGTSLTGSFPLVVNSGIASPYVAPAMGHLMETAANTALVLNLSAGVAVTGHLTYITEA